MTPSAEAPTEKIICALHGESYATFVCQHLVQGQGVGFCYTEAEPVRPDAWCFACDHFLAEHGGEWNDETEAFAQVTVLCAHCYDAARLRNAIPR